MYFTRLYADSLIQVAQFFPVVTLSGARQTGKTTLLRECFPNHHYVSLDLPSVAAQAERNPQEFFEAHPPPVLIDEVQYAPELFRHIKARVDEDRHHMGQYILTGSQKFTLMKSLSESLAGRSVILDLENLEWREVAEQAGLRQTIADISRFIIRGQFPELWRVPDLPRAAFYSSYLATYLERDVRQLINVTSLRDFERFIRALAPRSGQLLNKSDLARDVGVSVKAINDWLSVLQASNQVVLLEPWYKNLGKRLIKSPKVYFCDSGLLSFLLAVDPQTLESSPFKGQIWETFVFAELRKRNRLLEHPAELWFYRDSTRREIDFVYEKAGFLHFVECKWTEEPSFRDIETMVALHNELSNHEGSYRGGRHSLICNAGASYDLEPGVRVLNVGNLEQALGDR